MTKIKFLTLNRILYINKHWEKQAKKYETINYIKRPVCINARKALYRLPDCAEEYYLKTGDVILTAAYYLKNIIILQAFEDGNHRTALYATTFFLEKNGYKTKKINDECYLTFKIRLEMWRFKDYHTLDSMDLSVLKIKDNTTAEANYVFNFCLQFIKDKILR